jgi:hypothetical protein
MLKIPVFLATFAVALATPALAEQADQHAADHPSKAAPKPVTPAAAKTPAPGAGPMAMPHECAMMEKCMKHGDGPMAPDMMAKCMKPDSAKATPAPDDHKHE